MCSIPLHRCNNKQPSAGAGGVGSFGFSGVGSFGGVGGFGCLSLYARSTPGINSTKAKSRSSPIMA